MEKLSDITKLWKEYNKISNKLTKAMKSTQNIVGEFAELLVAEHYSATKLPTSNKSADLETPNKKSIQVKSRKLKKTTSTSLNVIRSWDFDYLVVVLFDMNGGIHKAIRIDSKYVKDLATQNKHQNGYILTTNKKLLEHEEAEDITSQISQLL